MYQPLLITKSKFDSLTAEQQTVLLAASEKADVFYLEEVKKEDADNRQVFMDAGVEIKDMTEEEFNAWRKLAQGTSYAAFVADVPGGQELLDKALAVE